MRHRKHRQSLGVTREHRAALLSNLAAALIRRGRIETTLTKARALRPFIERVITKAKKAAAAAEKKDAIHLRRTALRKVRDEDAITLLFNERLPNSPSAAVAIRESTNSLRAVSVTLPRWP